MTSRFTDREPCTPPALTQEAVERVANTLGKPDLLDLLKAAQGGTTTAADVLSVIPAAMNIASESEVEPDVQPPAETKDLPPWLTD